MTSTVKEIKVDMQTFKAEPIGWIFLDEGVCLYLGSDAPLIQVVGLVKPEMAASNILWIN